jgi:hypothetical protein
VRCLADDLVVSSLGSAEHLDGAGRVAAGWFNGDALVPEGYVPRLYFVVVGRLEGGAALDGAWARVNSEGRPGARMFSRTLTAADILAK